jgi:hypothetical protein
MFVNGVMNKECINYLGDVYGDNDNDDIKINIIIIKK